MKQEAFKIDTIYSKVGFVLNGFQTEAETVDEQILINEIEELRGHLEEKNNKLRKANDKLKSFKVGALAKFEDANEAVEAFHFLKKLFPNANVQIANLGGWVVKMSNTTDASWVIEQD